MRISIPAFAMNKKDTTAKERPQSQWRIIVRQFCRNKRAMVGLCLLLFITFCALFAPWLTPYDPLKLSYRDKFIAPNSTHWMGTDIYGRDLFTRILFGARISLRVGLIATGIGALGGVLLGLISGYYGRWIDTLVMRMMDMLLAFPGFLLALAVVTVLGTNLTNVMIAVGIAQVPRFTRLVRGSVLSAKENVYVEAARVVGCGDWKIMWRHILPNVIAPVIVYATLGVANAILVAASLSFLGLGAQPPTPEWGVILSRGRSYMRQAWWVTTFPGLAIMLTVLAINMVGDGLRDALDPRLRM